MQKPDASFDYCQKALAKLAVALTLKYELRAREPTWGYICREKLRRLNLSHPAELHKSKLTSDLSDSRDGWELYLWELYREARKQHREGLQKSNISPKLCRPTTITTWPPSLPGCLPSPFDHYELIDKLVKPGQEGTQGELYVAIDERHLESLCVIKFLIPQDPDELLEFYKNPDKLLEYDPAKLLEELTPSLSFAHPNIAPTKDLLDLRDCNYSRRQSASLTATLVPNMVPRRIRGQAAAFHRPPPASLAATLVPNPVARRIRGRAGAFRRLAPRIAYVMNYYPLSLHDGCAKYPGKYSDDQVSKWMNELIDAVNELHFRWGIVHRDVKWANILFEPNNTEAYEGHLSLVGARIILADCGTLGSLDKTSDLHVSRIDEYKCECYDKRDTPAHPGGQVCLPEMDIHAVARVLIYISQLLDGAQLDRDRIIYKALCRHAKLTRRTNGDRRWREVSHLVGNLAAHLFKSKSRAAELTAAVRAQVWQGKPRRVPNIHDWAVKLTIRTACHPATTDVNTSSQPDGDAPYVPEATQLSLVRRRNQLIAALNAMRTLTPRELQRVVALHLAGLSPHQIALLLRIDLRTVMFVLTRFLRIALSAAPDQTSCSATVR